MKAIILAAGYATRLRPLTERYAKPLLPVGGEPLVESLYRKIVEVDEIDAVHVVTNHRFASAFEAWTRTGNRPRPVFVHDDGTSTNEDRLGAIGDIAFTVDRAKIDDDLLVLAGDNLFDFSLRDLVSFFRSKNGASAIVLYRCPDLELVKQYSVVGLDGSGRVVSFVEKPKTPESNLVGTATYLYSREHVKLIRTYLTEGNSPDQPGNLIAWLHRRAPVYGWSFEGVWMDIGSHRELLEADNWLRAKRGLPTRTEYKVD